MRVFAHFLILGCAAVLVFPESHTWAAYNRTPGVVSAQGAAPDAASVLAAAREALGGEKRLSAVKNFVVTGRTRQVRGDNLVPIEFEIAAELPDRYVRKDEIPAQESGPTATGFNGDELIQFPVPTPPPARAGAPPPAPAQMDAMRLGRVATVKQDFVRLTLGLFAGSFSSYPLTFTYVGQAEAPQGKADVVDAKGPANFTARLFVNSQTHLPIMVSWQAPAGRGGPGGPGMPGGAPPAGRSGSGAAPAGQPSGPPQPPAGASPGGAAPAGPPPTAPTAAGAPPAGPPPSGAPAAAARGGDPSGAEPARGNAARGAAAAATPPVEFRIYYADYRETDGLQWPYRLRRASGPDTTEETTFDRFKINTKIDPKKFEVRK